jgi:putative flippase GtrA
MYLLLRPVLGPIAAVVLALGATTIGNSWAHRRWTLGRRGRAGLRRHALTSGVVACGGMAASVAALLGVATVGGGLAAELLALAAAWSTTTVARFVLLSRGTRADPATGDDAHTSLPGREADCSRPSLTVTPVARRRSR